MHLLNQQNPIVLFLGTLTCLFCYGEQYYSHYLTQDNDSKSLSVDHSQDGHMSVAHTDVEIIFLPNDKMYSLLPVK